MKEFTRRIAVVVGAVAVSVGLLGATATPADAAKAPVKKSVVHKDSSWGR